jgi:hypothetical protein
MRPAKKFDPVSLAFGLFFLVAAIMFLLDRSDSFIGRLGGLVPIAIIGLGVAMLFGGRKNNNNDSD